MSKAGSCVAICVITMFILGVVMVVASIVLFGLGGVNRFTPIIGNCTIVSTNIIPAQLSCSYCNPLCQTVSGTLDSNILYPSGTTLIATYAKITGSRITPICLDPMTT